MSFENKHNISNLKLCGEGDDREGLPHGETLLSVDEQRVGLDLEVVLQPCLLLQQALRELTKSIKKSVISVLFRLYILCRLQNNPYSLVASVSLFNYFVMRYVGSYECITIYQPGGLVPPRSASC